MRQLNSPASVVLFQAGEPTGSFRRASLFQQLLAGIIALGVCTSVAHAADEAARLKAQHTVTEAAQAEIAGDKARNLSLLHDAVLADPDNQLAHWQLGEIKVEGKWVNVEESQRRAAADPRQAEYLLRRAAATDDVQGRLELARWCNKSKLDDEAKFHFSTVLSLDPQNEEALRTLNVRWVNGQLVSREQVNEHKQRIQEAKNAARRWEPIVAKWRRAVAGHDVHIHDAALDEIRAINKIDAIPSIEAVTLGRDAFDMDHAGECLQIALAFLEALRQRPEQSATESILRHAAFSPGNKARALAAQELKERDPGNYVPILLDNLQMPIEFTYDFRSDEGGNVRYTQSLYREGPFKDTAVDASFSTMQHLLPGRRYRAVGDGKVALDGDDTDFARAQNVARVARGRQKQYLNIAATTESQVQQANAEIEQLSARIFPVLAMTTGESFQTQNQWWDWWREKNEYYTSERPVDYRIYTNTDHRYYGLPEDEIVRHSCFAKGTPVWTKSGLKPIETIQQGDFVLSQSVDTGELRFKPVATRTTRPSGKLVKVHVEEEVILSTTGHPFWVNGTGWRMAKELSDGANLYSLSAPARVHAVKDAADGEAYNLVVADFNTYFVGERGILVHDITPRAPTISALPGISKAVIASQQIADSSPVSTVK